MEIELPQSTKRSPNLERLGDHAESCIVCGLKTAGKFWVHMTTDWLATDEQDDSKVPNSQGAFPIGPECAKKLPKGFIFSNETSVVMEPHADFKAAIKRRTAAHTEGPWSYGSPVAINNEEVPKHSVDVYAANGTHICEKKIISTKLAEAEANARLIAAAPELLEALTEMLASYRLYVKNDKKSSFVLAVQQAIGKATGKIYF